MSKIMEAKTDLKRVVRLCFLQAVHDDKHSEFLLMDLDKQYMPEIISRVERRKKEIDLVENSAKLKNSQHKGQNFCKLQNTENGIILCLSIY